MQETFEAFIQQMRQERGEEQSRLEAEQKRLRDEQERKLAEEQTHLEVERAAFRKQMEERAKLEAERQQLEEARMQAEQAELPQVAYVPPLRPRLEKRVFKVNLEECLANYDDTYFISEFRGFCKVEKRKANPGEKKVEGTSESFLFHNMLGAIEVDIVANANGYTITYWENQPGEDPMGHEGYIEQAIDELKDQEVTVVVTVDE